MNFFATIFPAIYFLFLPYFFDNQHSITISAFLAIETQPLSIGFSNKMEVNNNGGHLQGIQSFENNSGEYFFLTGSSDSYSYYSVIKKDESPSVLLVNRLMKKPYKHAGGFQIFENYLTVGIEDNTTKDKSKVCIYNIVSPEQPLGDPLVIINRNGEKLRNTAGCVGITKYKNNILLAVGDWDTKNIDFYSGNLNNQSGNQFHKTGSINIEKHSRENWMDKNWYSYQNINLFTIEENLYLIGLGQNLDSENIADLYCLSEEKPGNFKLLKLASKKFECTEECSFKAGAGVEYKNNKFSILACKYHLEENSLINYFDN